MCETYSYLPCLIPQMPYCVQQNAKVGMVAECKDKAALEYVSCGALGRNRGREKACLIAGPLVATQWGSAYAS